MKITSLNVGMALAFLLILFRCDQVDDFFEDDFDELSGARTSFNIVLPNVANFAFTQVFDANDLVTNSVEITNAAPESITEMIYQIELFNSSDLQNSITTFRDTITMLDIGQKHNELIAFNTFFKETLTSENTKVSIVKLAMENSSQVTIDSLEIRQPGLLNAKIFRQITRGANMDVESISNTISFTNNTSITISELDFFLECYQSNSFLEENLQIQYYGQVSDLESFVASDKLLFDNSIEIPLVTDNVLFKVISTDRTTDHPFAGLYEGTYTLTNVDDMQTINGLFAYIDRTGESEFRLTGSPVFERFGGNITQNGEFRGASNIAALDSIASNSIALSQSGELTANFIIGKSNIYDTIQVRLNTINF